MNMALFCINIAEEVHSKVCLSYSSLVVVLHFKDTEEKRWYSVSADIYGSTFIKRTARKPDRLVPKAVGNCKYIETPICTALIKRR